MIDSSFILGTIVRVYQEEGGIWSPLGNISAFSDVNATDSLSLSGDRLAVGSFNATNGVSVYELQDNDDVWRQVGDTIDRDGWSVALAQEGTVLIIESTNEVQLYQWSSVNNEWKSSGMIPTSSDRINGGSAYSRMAAFTNGTIVLVEQTVYTIQIYHRTFSIP